MPVAPPRIGATTAAAAWAASPLRPSPSTTLVSLLLILTLPLHAATRTSANYTIATETADSGGRRATSASYTHDGSAGLVSGISTATGGTAKHGYIAQLFDVTGLVVGASSSDVNEVGTLQISARQLLDDATFLALDAGAVAWSPVSGPIASVSSSGLVTAGTVYQNSPASVQGSFAGFTGSISLNVLDTLPDNFGSYSADGLPDEWQVQYFGQDNPLAGPSKDATGTGQTNLFKYVAGLAPTDPNARFIVRIEPVSGQPAQMKVNFSPRLDGRTYTVKASTSLAAGSWSPLVSMSTTDNGSERTVTDLNATGTKKFYRVDIQK